MKKTAIERWRAQGHKIPTTKPSKFRSGHAPFVCEICLVENAQRKGYDVICIKCDSECLKLPPVPKRNCRDCGTALTADRYFNCARCSRDRGGGGDYDGTVTINEYHRTLNDL